MKIKLLLSAVLGVALLTGCETASYSKDSAVAQKNTQALETILAAQPEKAQARYKFRNPKETIEFFGVEPGMTVAEALPGGGWYSKVLLPFIGDEGTLVGVDYSLRMWPEFGGFANAEFLEKKKTWPATWTADAMEWRGGATPDIKAFAFETRDKSLDGTVDMVLFVRALHNLARFEEDGGFLTKALKDTHAMLKPGGTVGIVQHRAPEANDDSWANGSNGYLKQSMIISTMEKAGFKLVGKSEVNANPLDKPTTDDMVWRLPPTLGTSKKDAALKAKLTAVGESDRMTLKFKKK